MKEYTFPATVEQLGPATALVDAYLEELGCAMKPQLQIDVAVDEILGNIAHYAYPDGIGTITLRLETTDDGTRVRLTFIDRGTPFDPLAQPEPDVTASAEDRAIGGLGLLLVRRTMEALSYRREDGCNILSFMKTIRRPM